MSHSHNRDDNELEEKKEEGGSNKEHQKTHAGYGNTSNATVHVHSKSKIPGFFVRMTTLKNNNPTNINGQWKS